MITKKLNWKIWFFIVLLGGTCILAVKVICMLLTGQTVDEDGQTLGTGFALVMSALFLVVCSTYATTVYTLLRQYIVCKNTAFTADSSGVHNTFVMASMLAFMLAVPVKHIPWSAVTYVDMENNNVCIRVKSKEVNTGVIGRVILAALGYQFHVGFTKEKMTKREGELIQKYCSEQSKYINTWE